MMLLWANNHYHDFEGDHIMEDYLEAFESGLEQQVLVAEAVNFMIRFNVLQ